MQNSIVIKGARENNLKNIDLELPDFHIHVSRIEDHQVAQATVQKKERPESDKEKESGGTSR